MLKSKLMVMEAEYKLILTTREIKFGELFGVEILNGPFHPMPVEITDAEYDLIEFIRDGHQYIDVLRVHQKEPCSAEIDETIRGFKCRKKYKFPTE